VSPSYTCRARGSLNRIGKLREKGLTPSRDENCLFSIAQTGGALGEFARDVVSADCRARLDGREPVRLAERELGLRRGRVHLVISLQRIRPLIRLVDVVGHRHLQIYLLY